jgi:hypothetical protein
VSDWQPAQELADVFWFTIAYVDALFGHHLYGKRVDTFGRISASTVGSEPVATERPQKPFCHLAAAGVSRA